jgi:hypothetical protein
MSRMAEGQIPLLGGVRVGTDNNSNDDILQDISNRCRFRAVFSPLFRPPLLVQASALFAKFLAVLRSTKIYFGTAAKQRHDQAPPGCEIKISHS